MNRLFWKIWEIMNNIKGFTAGFSIEEKKMLFEYEGKRYVLINNTRVANCGTGECFFVKYNLHITVFFLVYKQEEHGGSKGEHLCRKH